MEKILLKSAYSIGFAVLILLVSTVAMADVGIESEDLEVIRGAVRDGLYEFASEKAAKFIRRYPGSYYSGDVWLMLGVSRYHTGRFEKALSALDQAKRSAHSAPLLPDILYWRGECLLELDRHEECIKVLKSLIERYPGSRHSADAFYSLGWAQAGVGSLEDAVETYRELLERFPTFKDYSLAGFKVGKWLYDSGKHKEAVEELEQFANGRRKGPYGADAWYWAAESRFQLKEWDEATENYQHALKLSKDPVLTAYASYGFGWVLAEQGQDDEAYEVMRDLLLEELPDELQASVRFKMAGILFRRKNYGAASAYYDDLLDNKKYGGRARFSLGECQYHLKMYKEALETYSSIPGDEKDLTVDIVNRMAWCHFKLGDYDRASDGFLKVIEVADSPSVRAEARTRLGDILFNQRKFKEAAEKYLQARKDGPDEEQKEHLAYWLGWSYYKLELYEDAAGEFELVLKDHADGTFVADARDKLARTYFMMGMFGEAAVTYLEILEDRSIGKETRTNAMYQVAECYYNAKDYMGAAEQFQEVISFAPGTELSKQALYGKAMCWQSSGDLKRANEEFRSYFLRHPNDVLASNAVLLRGNNLYKMTMYDEASEAYRNLVTRYPESEELHEAYYWLGWCFFNLDNMPRAAEVWQEALRVNPSSRYRHEILLGTAEAMWKQGRQDEPERIFEQLLTTDMPDDLKQKTLVGYGDFFQTSGQYVRAVAKYQESLKGPNVSFKAKAQFGMAESYYHGRDYTNALDAYTKVMYVHGHFPKLVEQARFKAARCLAKLERVNEARAIYHRIIREGGDNADEAKKLLEELKSDALGE